MEYVRSMISLHLKSHGSTRLPLFITLQFELAHDAILSPEGDKQIPRRCRPAGCSRSIKWYERRHFAKGTKSGIVFSRLAIWNIAMHGFRKVYLSRETVLMIEVIFIWLYLSDCPLTEFSCKVLPTLYLISRFSAPYLEMVHCIGSFHSFKLIKRNALFTVL